jgi:hypothetical protein
LNAGYRAVQSLLFVKDEHDERAGTSCNCPRTGSRNDAQYCDKNRCDLGCPVSVSAGGARSHNVRSDCHRRSSEHNRRSHEVMSFTRKQACGSAEEADQQKGPEPCEARLFSACMSRPFTLQPYCETDERRDSEANSGGKCSVGHFILAGGQETKQPSLNCEEGCRSRCELRG